MKCRECEKHLAAWLDRELPQMQAKEVQAHLESCPRCQRRSETLEQGMAAVDSLPQMRASAGFDAALSCKLQDARRRARQQEAKRPWWRIPLFATAAVSACAATLVAVVLFRTPPPPAQFPEPAELSQHLEMLQDYDLVNRLDALEGVEELEDLDVVENLDTLMEELS